MAVNLNAGPASGRGWGPGWPHCQTAKMVPLVVDGVAFPSGVRPEIHDLVELLVAESLERNYVPHLDDPGCWGFACRAIKTSTGETTDVPSNHSWGLAVDINAPHNVFGGATHQIPDAMARLWNTYGFRWGGDYSTTKDWMHFEFMGRPTDARNLTNHARKDLVDMALNQEQKDALHFVNGERAYLDGKPEPKDPGPSRQGWRFAQLVKESPPNVQPPGTAG